MILVFSVAIGKNCYEKNDTIKNQEKNRHKKIIISMLGIILINNFKCFKITAVSDLLEGDEMIFNYSFPL